MLVLSRKPGETIELTGGIRIKVTEIKGDVVRLGFEAPKAVLIFRSEVLGGLSVEQFSAAASPLAPMVSLVLPCAA